MKTTTSSNTKLETDFIVNNQWKIMKKLGSGSFGAVFQAKDINRNEFVAIKLEKVEKTESNKKKNCSLYLEKLHLSKLSGIKGIPKFLWNGDHEQYECLVIELLGNDLGSLLKKFKRFSQKTTCMIAIQVIQIIKSFHEKGILHRDLKPENMAVGLPPHQDQIFIFDFGISKIYLDSNGNQIPKVEYKPFIGTSRYASIAAHRGIEQCRKDDLESLGFICVYFLKGSLPWQNYHSDHNKTFKVGNMKQTLTVENLCLGLPSPFVDYFKYIRSLKYEDTPDYEYLTNLFKKILARDGDVNDMEWDWSKKMNSSDISLNQNSKQNLGADLRVSADNSFSRLPSVTNKNSLIINKSYDFNSQLKSSEEFGLPFESSNVENNIYHINNTSLCPFIFSFRKFFTFLNNRKYLKKNHKIEVRIMNKAT